MRKKGLLHQKIVRWTEVVFFLLVLLTTTLFLFFTNQCCGIEFQLVALEARRNSEWKTWEKVIRLLHEVFGVLPTELNHLVVEFSNRAIRFAENTCGSYIDICSSPKSAIKYAIDRWWTKAEIASRRSVRINFVTKMYY